MTTNTTSSLRTAEITVMSTAAFKEAYLELVPQFEAASGHKVSTIWVGTADLPKRTDGSETVDIVIAAHDAIDSLTKQGRLTAGSRTDLASSGVGIAVRSGAQRIDITSGERIKAALLAANSIGFSSGPSGVYLTGLFQTWGIADAIAAKVRRPQPGLSVGEMVARGEAEIGFQQVSELLPVEGIDYLGPLPGDIQQVTMFSAGLHAGSRAGEAAKALVSFLTSPQAAPVIRKTGMTPA